MERTPTQESLLTTPIGRLRAVAFVEGCSYLLLLGVAMPLKYLAGIPIAVKVKDQWPTADDKEVEVKLAETKPYAIQDTVKGTLEWHLTLAPSSKTNVSFTYSIRRPKGWRLHQ